MLRFAKPDTARGLAPDVAAEPGRTDKDVYDRHSGSLYRQALFTLGDSGMAEQVVSDVIVEECVRPGVICCQDPERRLAVSAYRRCMELAGSPAWTSRVPARRTGGCASCAGQDGLNARERGALGLMIFGGGGYRHAGSALGIPASEMAVLLRAALVKAGAAEPASLPAVEQEQAWR